MNASIALRRRVAPAVLPGAGAVCAVLGFTLSVTADTNGLAPIQLSTYYQPESVAVAPTEQPWYLPLPWPSVANGTWVGGVLHLSTNACTAIERNGFVVVPFGPTTNTIEPYAILRDIGVPAFITSDTLLHLYHVQFDDILKCVETNEFFPRLVSMTSTLLDEALRQKDSFTGDLQEAATRNAAFLAVAAGLLGQTAATPADVTALADAESALIAAHAGFGASPIFTYQEDYSQYVPRGHYTRSEALKKYFQAMMWYGRLAFLLKGSDHYGPDGEALVSIHDARIQTLQAVLLTLALDRLAAGGQPIADTWNRIYGVTAFFVGLADDLTPYEYKEAVLKLFGAAVGPGDFDDDQKLFDLKQELAAARHPEIYGGTGDCQVPPNATPEDLDRVLDKTQGMRVMGQRFIPDAYVFQQLVLPVTGPFVGSGKPFTMEVTQAGPRRCFPRGLDVMAVLGAPLALNILDREGDTAYVGYDTSINDLLRQFDSFSDADWQRNLYWAWLYALRPLLRPCGSSEPPFMQTPAWQAKQLNTALASWTELRHDTILYAKQSYTPVATVVPPPPDRGFVEPVPEFYQRLLTLTRMTRVGLSDLQVLNADQGNRLLVLEDILIRLRDIAITELESRPLTEAQYDYISHFDVALAPLTNGIPDAVDTSTALVADVHTDSNTGQVLEEGVGFVKLMVVAYQLPDDRLVLGAGPVMSYYEFKWPMNDRLTDEQWSSLLAAGPQPAAPTWTGVFAEPATWLPDTHLANPTATLRLLGPPSQCVQAELGWPSVAGQTYRVRYSEDLKNWRLLGTPVTASGEVAVLSDSSPVGTACRFYRVEVVP